MSDLREKAERLVLAHEQMEALFPALASRGDVLSASVEVCRAYLAEHSADEADPVTRKWLESIGFESNHGRLGLGQLQLTFYEGWNSWWAFSDFKGSTRLRDDLKTRGDIRRLLSALGISTKEIP